MSSCLSEYKIETEGKIENERICYYSVPHRRDYFATIRGKEYQLVSNIIYPSSKKCQKGDWVKVLKKGENRFVLGKIDISDAEIIGKYQESQAIGAVALLAVCFLILFVLRK